ncbi:phosphatidylserine decarboxylase [Stemphylium lycopersici]|uniref:Phosphatidylserine decarboxylase n=1 Tax=Stemphylium lycopersici TaxID=183478 RepID=A0A364N1Q3_STELY|nr:phosphatidylserine decarboxylase [Stemphylium lycopersici]
MAYRHLISRQDGAPPTAPIRSPEYMAENQAARLMAVEGPLFALSSTAVLVRFYVRIFMLKTFGWDDAMMAIAMAISAATLGLFLKVIDLGLGKHAEAFPMENVFPFFKIMYFYSILIISAYSFIKLSIGFFLLRLADRTRWRPFLIGMLVFLALFTIGSTFAIIFQCIPVQAGWDYNLRPPVGDAKCYDATIFKNVGVFNSSINIATDLIFALTPIPMVWKLQVTIQTRVGLAVILSLGLFASAVAIYKTPMQANFFKIADWSGDGSWYYIWQQVEMHVGIIAACLPTMKPLFASFFGQVRSIATRGRTTGSNGLNSTPFRSKGYVKQSEHHPSSSFAMKNMSEASQSTGRDPYGEDVVLGRDTYTVEAGRGRDEYERGRNQACESDGSILSHEAVCGPKRSSMLPRGLTIVRTTEVDISR